jgi:3-oxoacyl-[acyl-carrier-protein] synthase III
VVVVQQFFEIAGTGHYLPKHQVSATEVEQRAGLEAGWVMQNTMVETRYECRPPETLTSMATEAIHAALHNAKLSIESIDMILDGSTCRQQPIPCNAAMIQASLGEMARGIPCVDIQSTCLGFISAVVMANGLFATAGMEHVLIVCSEAGLAGINWAEPESATIIGDGAAAVVLRRRAPTPTFFYRHETFSQHIHECQVRGGGHLLPYFEHNAENDHEFRFRMDGPRLFRTALKRLPPMIEAILEDANLTPDQLLAIPHQASPRAVDAMREMLGFDASRFINRTAKTGNLIAASIPLVLSQLRQERAIESGRPLMFLGTSAGYSQAAVIFE